MQHSEGLTEYQDEVGVQYHYPKQYFRRIVEGERFVYCRPQEKSDGKKSKTVYFGTGIIGHVTEDVTRDGHKYCQILDFLEFPVEVPYREPNGTYLETGSTKIPVMQNAVRTITDGNLQRILQNSGLGRIEKAALERTLSANGDREKINILDNAYKTATPRERQRLVRWIERGSVIGGRVKALNNHVCQVCGIRPFMMKSGRPYAEAHHVIPLEKREPGSLASTNVICLCANCHRKMHFCGCGDSKLRR